MNLPATLLFIVLVILPWGLEQVAYSRFVGNPRAVEQRKSAKVVRSYSWAYLWDAAFFLVLVAAGFRFIMSEQPFAWWEWVGYAFFPLGIFLRIWALRELGAYYDAQISVLPGHKIISSGPYHFMRHPLHLGTTLQIVGLAFFAPLWLGLPVALITLIFTLYSDRYEDGILLRELGADYEKYYLQTWDIVDLFLRKTLSGSSKGT